MSAVGLTKHLLKTILFYNYLFLLIGAKISYIQNTKFTHKIVDEMIKDYFQFVSLKLENVNVNSIKFTDISIDLKHAQNLA